jgi:hypothetical protein
MKALHTAVLASIFATGAAVATADDQEMAQCKEQVDNYYGGVADMQYVGQRRFRDGKEMKFAVNNTDSTTGYTSTRVATCWLGAENMQASMTADDAPMVADVYDSITDSIVDPGLLPK